MSAATAERVEQISLEQIRGNYDDDAVSLVEAYHMAGWSSHMSARGHVIVRAPDGSDSGTVTRDSLRGRSGRNSAAPLKRWLRREKKLIDAALAAEQTKPAKASNAFGIANISEAKLRAQGLTDLPPRIEAQMREDAALKAYARKLISRGKDPQDRLVIAGQTDTGSFRKWVVVDVAAQIVVAHGDEITDEQAYDLAVDNGRITRKARKPRKVSDDAAGSPVTTPGEETTMKLTECPDCHEKIEAPRMSAHRSWQHTGFVCPDCSESSPTPRALGIHQQEAHGKVSPAAKARQEAERLGVPYLTARQSARTTVCRWCNRDLETSASRAAHEVHAHIHKGDLGPGKRPAAKRVTKPVTRSVTTPNTPVDKPATKPEPVAVKGDVPVTSPAGAARLDLSEVLGTLPTGGDAQDMVAKIRAIVTPPLVGELLEQRKENDRLRHENEILAKENEDLTTRMTLMREALGA